jgi:hypothetical protein
LALIGLHFVAGIISARHRRLPVALDRDFLLFGLIQARHIKIIDAFTPRVIETANSICNGGKTVKKPFAAILTDVASFIVDQAMHPRRLFRAIRYFYKAAIKDDQFCTLWCAPVPFQFGAAPRIGSFGLHRARKAKNAEEAKVRRFIRGPSQECGTGFKRTYSLAT